MNSIRRLVVLTGPMVAASVILSPLSALSAEANVVDLAAGDLVAATATALERAQFLERPEKDVLEKLLSESVGLQKLLSARASATSEEFAVSLADLTVVVQAVEFEKGSTEGNFQNLALVLRDVQIKRDHLQHAQGGFAFKKRLKVLVLVTTYKEGQPFAGYEVSFNPLRLADTQQARYPVSSTTNDARRDLPPGLYVMSLRRGSVAINKTVEVGEDGADEQTIRIDL